MWRLGFQDEIDETDSTVLIGLQTKHATLNFFSVRLFSASLDLCAVHNMFYFSHAFNWNFMNDMTLLIQKTTMQRYFWSIKSNYR